MGKINTNLIQFSKFITSISATTVSSELQILNLNTYKLTSLNNNAVCKMFTEFELWRFTTLFTLLGGQDRSDNIGWIPTFIRFEV
jgi:hypothetical protein